MVVHEFHSEAATIRIHDGFYEPNPKDRIASVSRLISESYRRRYFSMPQAAVQAVGNPSSASALQL